MLLQVTIPQALACHIATDLQADIGWLRCRGLRLRRHRRRRRHHHHHRRRRRPPQPQPQPRWRAQGRRCQAILRARQARVCCRVPGRAGRLRLPRQSERRPHGRPDRCPRRPGPGPPGPVPRDSDTRRTVGAEAGHRGIRAFRVESGGKGQWPQPSRRGRIIMPESTLVKRSRKRTVGGHGHRDRDRRRDSLGGLTSTPSRRGVPTNSVLSHVTRDRDLACGLLCW